MKGSIIDLQKEITMADVGQKTPERSSAKKELCLQLELFCVIEWAGAVIVPYYTRLMATDIKSVNHDETILIAVISIRKQDELQNISHVLNHICENRIKGLLIYTAGLSNKPFNSFIHFNILPLSYTWHHPFKKFSCPEQQMWFVGYSTQGQWIFYFSFSPPW